MLLNKGPAPKVKDNATVREEARVREQTNHIRYNSTAKDKGKAETVTAGQQ